MLFSPYLGVGGRGGLPRGLGHNLLMQLFRLGGSKMENLKTDFFDNLTIQNDQISYAKHVVAPLYVFFTLFGCLGGGGAPKGSRAQPTYAAFPPEQLKKRLSLSPLRGALSKAIEFGAGRGTCTPGRKGMPGVIEGGVDKRGLHAVCASVSSPHRAGRVKPVRWVERVWFGGLCRYIVSKGGYDRIKGTLVKMADEVSGGSRPSQCVD